jgi:hypothetical protein
MPGKLRAIREVAWQIDSVAVPTRDGHRRVERAYQILVGGGPKTHQQGNQPREGSDACGDLRQGVHRATGAAADD